MMVKRWELLPSAPMEHLRRYRNISPVIAQLLFNRGYEDPQAAYHFLYDKELVANPFEFKDMPKAVGRIRQAIRTKELIVVYGDFDADGVTSTTLLTQVLRALNANVQAYIPHRVDEGYGLNTPALLELAKRGVKLVITVDCGIRSVQEVEDAKTTGMDMIITDHHSVGSEIPDAFAVVNPQQEDCPGDSRLAGVGVSFMLAYALLQKQMEIGGKRAYPRIRVSDLLDLVAIGTVADIMPLNTILNRILVRHGLETLNSLRRPGLRALAEVAGLKQGQISAESIGFAIGPRINAAGRLESAMIAYKLLSSTSLDDARPLADELQKLNTKRQNLTREAQVRIRQQIEQTGEIDHSLIFAMDEHVLPGIVGLVAGRLTEELYRPAIVLERGETESRASCRSIPQFHITHALDECADLLVRHGGHALAAGFTVLNENIPELKTRLQDIAQSIIGGQILTPTLKVDMELDMRQVSMPLVQELSVLEPTGHENKPPVFMTRNVKVVDSRTVGSDNSHLKLKLTANGEPPIDAIGFRLGEWLQDMPEFLDIAYYLEVNEYQGRRNLQLNLQDICPAGAGACL